MKDYKIKVDVVWVWVWLFTLVLRAFLCRFYFTIICFAAFLLLRKRKHRAT